MNEEKLIPIEYTKEDVLEFAETHKLEVDLQDFDLFISEVLKRLSEYWYQEFLDTLADVLEGK